MEGLLKDSAMYLCTKEDPWSKEKGTPSIHPDANLIREREDWFDGCDLEDYECPNCGMKWTTEIPR